MSIWVRDDGTITDEGDPTAFEYVPASQHNKLREALRDIADCADPDRSIAEYAIHKKAHVALRATEDV